MALTVDRRPRRQGTSLPGMRALPGNSEAERSVLSAILLNGQHIAVVIDTLQAEDFFEPAHQKIYQALADLHQNNKKIDLISIQDLLKDRGELEEIGGTSYLFELQEDIPALGLIEQHGKIIKEKSLLRGLIGAASDIIGSCFDRKDVSIDDILDDAERKIFAVAHKMAKPTFVQLNLLLKQTFHMLAQTQASQGGVTGIPTGFSKLDSMTSGLQRGELVIFAARPSMGKTAFALNLALNAAREGFSIAIFSLEMPAEQLLLRMLASESRIPLQRIRNVSISTDEWVTLTNVAAQLAEQKVYFDDTATLTIRELRAKARKLKAQDNIDLIVIDYLQLISGGGKHENRTQEISAISRALKALAKELNIPVIALSQLSRSLESRMDKRPLLSDLRESGAIEQDGDLIAFLYRDAVYNADVEHPDLTEIIIGKQRNGPIGTCYASFRGDTTSFDDLPDHR